MLSSISRSAYICSQCRSRLSHNILQKSRPIVRSPVFRGLKSLSPQLRTFACSTVPRSQDDVLSYEDEPDLKHTRFSNNKSKPWENAGLRPIVAETLLRAYPNAERPTTVQRKMLTALTYGYSVAARGLPGTGKSFAIAAWLLGLERALRVVKNSRGKEESVPTTSALVLVPNVDLAVQYYNIIINMLENSDSKALQSNPDSFVQLLYRKSNETELEQLVKLQRHPNPHIIIAPSTIILDILADKEESVRNLIDITCLKVIVLEEIDAAITQLQFFSKMKKPKHPESWRNKQVPVQILLDYIIKCRLAEAVKNRVIPVQPQLVFPTATLSAAQIKRFLFLWHREWLDTSDVQTTPQVFNGPHPGEEWKRKARSNSLLSIEDPQMSHNKIIQFVPDHLHHHVVAYDLRTGTLRDAPLPKIDHTDKLKFTEEISELEKAQDSMEEWDTQPEPGTVTTYPEKTVVSIIKKLLEHDNYPTNVVVAISPEADLSDLRDKLNEAGIKSRALIALKWNDDRESGKLPIGRTDMLLSPSVRRQIDSEAKGGDMSETTVWVTSFFFCRGLHLPGIKHLYILHRLSRTREYITYAGRVASWPYASIEDELKDPRSLGKDRRGTGKIVSVVLEDNSVDNPELEPEPVDIRMRRKHHTAVKSMVIESDGSEMERLSWANEAVRFARIGCKIEPYFATEGESQEKAVDEGLGSEATEVEGVVEDKKGDHNPRFLMEALGLLDEELKSAPGPRAENGQDELGSAEANSDKSEEFEEKRGGQRG